MQNAIKNSKPYKGSTHAANQQLAFTEWLSLSHNYFLIVIKRLGLSSQANKLARLPDCLKRVRFMRIKVIDFLSNFQKIVTYTMSQKNS